jgi:hypothetical protein
MTGNDAIVRTPLRRRRDLFLSSLVVLSLFCISAPSVAATADLPATGQTGCWNDFGSPVSCAGTGQDADKMQGEAWPQPRFVDNGNGTVTDSLTGLVWLRNANCFGVQTWTDALSSTNSLASGTCGLTDGSAAGQWRLPTVNELQSLLHAQQTDMGTWLNTQGFSNVQSNGCWSSTTYAPNTTYAWLITMSDGSVSYDSKTNVRYVWPVRAGQ